MEVIKTAEHLTSILSGTSGVMFLLVLVVVALAAVVVYVARQAHLQQERFMDFMEKRDQLLLESNKQMESNYVATTQYIFNLFSQAIGKLKNDGNNVGRGGR
jgi:uncharacterized protein HemX